MTPRNRRYSDEEKAQAVALYLGGLSMRQVSLTTGIGDMSVHRFLRAAGIELRSESVKPRYQAKLKEAALGLYAGGLSSAAVAGSLGLKGYTVKEWVEKAGIVRSMSRAAALSIVRHGERGRSIKTNWFSTKTGRVEHAGSLYEAVRMRQLDQDESVVTWGRCYDAIPYLTRSGRKRRYLPDFRVVYAAKTIVEEVKPLNMVGKGDNPQKFAAAKLRYSAIGIAFRVVTEDDLGVTPADYAELRSKRLDEKERQERRAKRRRDRLAVMYANETDAERLARRKLQNAKAKRLRHARLAAMTPEQQDSDRARWNAQSRVYYRRRQGSDLPRVASVSWGRT